MCVIIVCTVDHGCIVICQLAWGDSDDVRRKRPGASRCTRRRLPAVMARASASKQASL
jgi:hypothetical protein